MATTSGYFYIDENYKGKLAISKDIIYNLVDISLKNLKGISIGETFEKGQFAKVVKPCVITSKNGITDIKVYVAVIKNKNIQKAANEIQKELINDLTLYLGHTPFIVRVKVEELI